MTTDAQPNTDTTPTEPDKPAFTRQDLELVGSEARDHELTELAERDPGTYYHANDGQYAREHLALRRAMEASNVEDDGAVQQAEADDLADANDVDLDAPVEGPEQDVGDAEVVEASDLGYELPVVEGYTWSDADRTAIATQWREELDGLADDERDAFLSRYASLRVQLDKNDKSETKAATEALARAWGGREAVKSSVREIKTFLGDETRVSAALAAKIKEARSPSGGRLVNDPEFAQMLLQMARGQQGRAEPSPPHQPQGRAALQQELDEIIALRNRDITEYWQPWKATGKSGADRALEIMRELGDEAPAKPSAADLRAEEREIQRLRESDFDMFRFGDWRGTGRPAADRLANIRAGRT